LSTQEATIEKKEVYDFIQKMKAESPLPRQ